MVIVNGEMGDPSSRGVDGLEFGPGEMAVADLGVGDVPRDIDAVGVAAGVGILKPDTIDHGM